MNTVVVSDQWTRSPWIWGPLEYVGRPQGDVPYWRRCGIRSWTHTWVTQDYTEETIVGRCPNNFENVEGWCTWMGLPDEAPQPNFKAPPDRIETVPDGPPQTHTESGTDTTCLLVTYFGDIAKARVNTKGLEGRLAHYMNGPRLIAGDRLSVRGRGLKSIRVNGVDLGSARTVRADDCPPGTSAIDLVGAIGKEERDYGLVVSVLPRIRIDVAEPVVTTRSQDAADRLSLSAWIVNQSHADQSVLVEVVGAPEGWRARLVGPPFRRLEPDQRAAVEVEVESWSHGRQSLALPFGIRATPMGDARSAVQVTLYVGPGVASGSLAGAMPSTRPSI